MLALSEGLKRVDEGFLLTKQSNEVFFSPDDVLEEMESLVGIAFVTIQTYISGAVSDANKIAAPKYHFGKDQLLKEFGKELREKHVTNVEVCDAVANYFKHHDEWRSWEPTERNRRTLTILRSAGMNENVDYPCIRAFEMLSPESQMSFVSLLEEVSVWRKVVIAAVKKVKSTS